MKIRVARLKVVVNTPTRLIGDAREGRPVPHVGLPAKTAGPWRAWEAGCPVRARAGDHRAGAPGRCAKASKEGQGADAGAGSARSRAGAGRARAGAWWRRPGAHRAVGGRSPGAGPASTPDGRSEDPPAGVGGRRRGSRGKYLKESMPLLPGLLEGAGEIRREPRHEPGRQGRAGWPRARRAIDRRHCPGRGPRRAQPVHDQWASPLLRSSIKVRRVGRSGPWPSPGLFEAGHGCPLRSGARSGERSQCR